RSMSVRSTFACSVFIKRTPSADTSPLSLHDALPILCIVTQRPAELDPTILSQCNTIFSMRLTNERDQEILRAGISDAAASLLELDRKSTRLNSSHRTISYAVFCLKKKNNDHERHAGA